MPTDGKKISLTTTFFQASPEIGAPLLFPPCRESLRLIRSEKLRISRKDAVGRMLRSLCIASAISSSATVGAAYRDLPVFHALALDQHARAASMLKCSAVDDRSKSGQAMPAPLRAC